MPESVLILNPQDYNERPKGLRAMAAAGNGDFALALQLGSEVQQTAPGFFDLDKLLPEWNAMYQRNQTAVRWAEDASLLVAYLPPRRCCRQGPARPVLHSLNLTAHPDIASNHRP